MTEKFRVCVLKFLLDLMIRIGILNIEYRITLIFLYFYEVNIYINPVIHND